MPEPDTSRPTSSRPPAGEPPRTGIDRLRRALRHPSRAQVSVAVLVAVLGFAAVTQVRSNDANDTYAGLPQSDLIQALNGLSAASRRADSEITKLRQTRNKLRSSTQRRTTALQQAQQQLETLGILAGTAPATGPGIRITVRDPHGSYSVNHLLDGIEELRDAGAEAMQMNGRVRIVAQTSFAATEDGIRVDGQVLHPPYVLDVIGNPDTLSKALNFPGGFKDDVALDEGTTRVRKSQHVTVDVTRPTSAPDYARPVNPQ